MSGKNNSIPIAFLVGGLGTRLREVNPDLPKPMIPIFGKPFLHWLVEKHVRQGFCSFTFLAAYKAEVIENYKWKKFFPNCSFQTLKEPELLGTGGAALLYLKQNKSPSFWLINGDTCLDADLPSPVTFSSEFKAVYTGIEKPKSGDDISNLHVESGRVTQIAPGGLFLDAGAIWIKQETLQNAQHLIAPYSIHQALESSIKANAVGFHLLKGNCYDIGTPARYRRFEAYLKQLES